MWLHRHSPSTTAPAQNEGSLPSTSVASSAIFDTQTSTDILFSANVPHSSAAPVFQSTITGAEKDVTGRNSGHPEADNFSDINIPSHQPFTSTSTALLSTLAENLSVTSTGMAPATSETPTTYTPSNFAREQSSTRRLNQSGTALSIDSNALWTSPDDFFIRPVSASAATTAPDLALVSTTPPTSSQKLTISVPTIDEGASSAASNKEKTPTTTKETVISNWSTEVPRKSETQGATSTVRFQFSKILFLSARNLISWPI